MERCKPPGPAVKTDHDRAEDDAGNNIGRGSRYGLLGEFREGDRKTGSLGNAGCRLVDVFQTLQRYEKRS